MDGSMRRSLTCAGEPEPAGWFDPEVSSVSASDCSDPSGGPAGGRRTAAASGTSELQDRQADHVTCPHVSLSQKRRRLNGNVQVKLRSGAVRKNALRLISTYQRQPLS